MSGRLVLIRHGESHFAFTSVLKRAVRTLWIVLGATDLTWIPIEISWGLNERYCGALRSLNKAEMMQLCGAERMALWRRGYAVPPPALWPEDPRQPRFDPRYSHVDPGQLPDRDVESREGKVLVEVKECTAESAA